MIDFVFTIDYEIYGNGEGSLKKHVYDPTEKLMNIFEKYNRRFVTFVELAEFEKIESEGTDNYIGQVKNQIKTLYQMGYEIGLHLHPQWYNAHFTNEKWVLDYSEYNLCLLPRGRIVKIIDSSIVYIRSLLGSDDFTPLSFRAGNWLFQPSHVLAKVLADKSIKVDSSLFKGGVQKHYKLDYRQALKNDYYWSFTDDINEPDPEGLLIELPIYTRMVPFWKMFTKKRIGLQQKNIGERQFNRNKYDRVFNLMRFFYPMKLDFCRMTINELVELMEFAIKKDKKSPEVYKPIIAIGHTKDLMDFFTLKSFFDYLSEKKIEISTFEEIINNKKL